MSKNEEEDILNIYECLDLLAVKVDDLGQRVDELALVCELTRNGYTLPAARDGAKKLIGRPDVLAYLRIRGFGIPIDQAIAEFDGGGTPPPPGKGGRKP